MKKLLLIFTILMIAVAVQAQSLFKPVPKDLFTTLDKGLKAGEPFVTHAWLWRFDATVNLEELTWDKATKQFTSSTFSAIGPGIGFKHFIPTSAIDPTPYENYGFSAAVLFGTNIYAPDLSKIKVALEADLFQYLKFGVTYTANTTNWFGIFIGSGITF